MYFLALVIAKVPWTALSALGFGAIVGAVGADLLSLWREKRQDDRERNGFLRLVRNEMSANREWVKVFWTEPSTAWGYDIMSGSSPLSMEAWKEVRTKLARLLPDDHFLTDSATT